MKKRLLLFTLCLGFFVCTLGLTACGHEHKYTDQVIAPTCTALGYTLHTCECGDNFADTYVANIGHSFTTYVSNNDATCSEDGTKTSICDREGCSVTDTVTVHNSAIGHNFSNYVSNDDATCSEEGTKTARCINPNCTETITIDDEESMINHSFLYGICTMCSASNRLEYELSTDKNSYIVKSVGTFNGNNLTIPKYYNKKPVIAVADRAFQGCTFLTSVTIGECVENIGYSAFNNCTSLKNISIGSNVRSIGYFAFDNCRSLVKTNYTGTINQWVTIDFGSNPLEYSNNLYINNALVTEVNLIEVNYIGKCAFYGCDSLRNVTIGDCVVSIGYDAFYSCDSLMRTNYLGTIDQWGMIEFENSYSNPVVYSNNLYINDELLNVGVLLLTTNVGKYSFYENNSLNNLILGDSVEDIGDYSFYNCSMIESVTIGNGVKSIGINTFRGCILLQNITFDGTMQEWNIISKGKDWNYDVLATYVQCSDGRVTLS